MQLPAQIAYVLHCGLQWYLGSAPVHSTHCREQTKACSNL